MFAVPGWSVSNDALKPQSEQKQQPAAKENDKPNNNKPNNKRKRNDNVTKGNVDAMYRQHIEGQKSTPVNKKADKKKSQNQKPQNGDVSNAQKSQEQKKDPKPKKEDKPDDNKGNKPSKKQKKNNKNNKPERSQQEDNNNKTNSNDAPPETEPIPPAPPTTEAKLTPLQQAMRQKLVSSRFRHLNETLYTTPSEQALELFSSNPELFNEYHAGFSRQVQESWPSNPVDGYIKTVRSRGGVSDKKKPDKKPNQKGLPLPRRPNGACTIVDLGCGDAQFARALTPSADKLKLKFLSYDLHAANEYITKADITNLPLKDGSADIAVFCLSLMGTNWVSFVEEAWRVLRSDGKGECWVSEVKSRFGKVVRKKGGIGAKKPSKTEQKKLKKKQANADDAESDADDADIYAEDARPSDNDDTDISSFVEVFRTRGFVLKPEWVDKSNKMFVRMEFVKQSGAPVKGKHAFSVGAGVGAGKKKFVEKPRDDGMMDLSPEEEASVLKPCVYKTR